MSEISNAAQNVLAASSLGRRIRWDSFGRLGSYQLAERLRLSAHRWSQFPKGGFVCAVGLNPLQHLTNSPATAEIIGDTS